MGDDDAYSISFKEMLFEIVSLIGPWTEGEECASKEDFLHLLHWMWPLKL